MVIFSVHLFCCSSLGKLSSTFSLQVIAKLTDGKATHIPYRDSKLTRLLQSSLSGHGRISVSSSYKLYDIICAFQSCLENSFSYLYISLALRKVFPHINVVLNAYGCLY